jgi:hypothetical protein
MKYIHLNALFLMVVFHTSCGQNQTNVPQDNIKSNRAGYSESQLKEAATSKVPMSMVRNVKQARNGDILIASYLGVFRYDGTSFTNISSEISSPRFSSLIPSILSYCLIVLLSFVTLIKLPAGTKIV